MIEVWKQVKGYEGLYDLRNDGLIYSHPRKGTKGGYTYGSIDSDGYLLFELSKNGKQKRMGINKLVYETFIGEIPEGYDVHHINHIRTDNRIENLELISKSEHAKKHIEEHKNKSINAMNKKTSKSVLQYTLDGKFVAEYKCIMEAERQTGINNPNIIACCKNKRKQAGGYIWKYV